jgi:cell division protein FtsQ
MKTIGWSLLGLSCMVLLVAAMKSKGTETCRDIAITIEGATEHVFVKKADVVNVLSENNIHAGENLNDIDIGKLEGQLEQNAWIQDAELFFDNKQILHMKIFEREPIARIFPMQGSSFYIDSTALRLPISENAVARLIVFTSFPSDKKVLSKPDSLVLADVKKIALYIKQDSFLTAQTAQVNITQHGTYELIPVVGDQVIRIGNADSLDEKFTKLRAFYTQIWSKVGFEKYSVIDIQYHGQVVAVKRGQMNGASDTAKAVLQLAQAEKKLNQVLRDTLYAAPMKQVSVDSVGAQTEKPVVGKKGSKTGATNRKEAEKKNPSGDKKPKAVMPGKVKG